MGILITILLGALAGWLASMIMNRNDSMGALANIVVGIVGAFLANLILAPFLGVNATLSSFSIEGFLVALAGAVVLLALINLATRRSIR